MLRAIVTDPATRVLRPTPLSGDAVREWVRAAVDGEAGDAFCAACHETTGGNPFLVPELLHEVSTSGSGDRAGGRGGARARARGRSPPSCSSASSASRRARPRWRGGRDPRRGRRPRIAAELAGLDATAAEEALDALCRADVLTRDADRLGFVHPIVLAAIYNDLPCTRLKGHRAAPPLLPSRRGAGGGRLAPRPRRRAATHGRSSGCARRPPARSSWAIPRRAPTWSGPWRSRRRTPRAAVSERARRAEAQSGRPTARSTSAPRWSAPRRSRTSAARSRRARPQPEVPGRRPSGGGGAAPRPGGARRAVPGSPRSSSIELVACAYISLAGRPLLAAEIAAMQPRPRPATRLDRFRLHLMAARSRR